MSLWGGPPFRTDDPETVDYQHFEMASGIEYENDRGTLFGTAPHFDMNYGAAPNVQAHLMVSDDYVRNKGGPTLLGPGDVELGVKYRFVQESEYVPMVAIYPLFEVPTASRARSLGTGQPQLFFPVWLQKSEGPWTSYGGGGYWINPGGGNENYWYAGWILQRDITKWLTLGAEVFHQTQESRTYGSETGYNMGAIVNFTQLHHFICSAGTDIHGPANFFFYAAYLLTWGPHGAPEERRDTE
jgi:hypothetical protein